MSKVENATEMSFVRIEEAYPDEYILAKIIEINHEKGKQVGIALYTAPTMDELLEYARNEGIISETIILDGVNLTSSLLVGLL